MCPMPQSQQQPRNDCKLVWTKNLLFHSRKNTIHAWSSFCIRGMLLFLNLDKCKVTYSTKSEARSYLQRSEYVSLNTHELKLNLQYDIWHLERALVAFGSWEEISVHTTETTESSLTFSPCEDSVQGGSVPPRKGSSLKATMLHCELPASQKINFCCL